MAQACCGILTYLDVHTFQLVISSVFGSVHIANIILTSVLYGLIIKKIRQHLNEVVAFNQQSEITNTDKKLVFFCLSMFMINFVYAVIFFGIAFVSPKKDVTAYLIVSSMYMIVGDVVAYCNPWFMLLFCRSVRDHFWAIIRCKEPSD